MAEEIKTTKKQKVINCTGCNKPTKRLRRYYRDSKYYCSKRCWQKNKTKGSQPKEA